MARRITKESYVSTGFKVLNDVIKNGIPEGKICMIQGTGKSFYEEHMEKKGYKHMTSPDGVGIFYPNTVTLRFTKDGKMVVEEETETQNYEEWEEE